MKKTKILVGLLIAHALNSCSLFTDAEPTLPPATQNGAETFGCLVNGKIFVPKGGGKYEGLTKNYDGSLAIFTLNTVNGEVKSSVGILINNCNSTGEYFLNQPKALWYKGLYGWSIPPIEGKAIITKFERGEDKANNLHWLIVSGTFEGVLVHDKNPLDTIRITQGRFDVKFQ